MTSPWTRSKLECDSYYKAIMPVRMEPPARTILGPSYLQKHFVEGPVIARQRRSESKRRRRPSSWSTWPWSVAEDIYRRRVARMDLAIE